MGNTNVQSVSVVSKVLSVTYQDDSDVIIASDIVPGKVVTKTFTVNNSGKGPVYYSLKIDNIDSTFIRNDFKYSLITDNKVITTGYLLSDIQDGVQFIQNKILIDVNEVHEYTLELEYINSKENQSIDMGKSLGLRINIDDAINTVDFINIPIDSRPITRSNFEYLVNSTEFNYLEVSDGLDSFDGTQYTSGSVEDVQNNLIEYLKLGGYNSTVLVNLSSFMFGGLINTRNPDLYTKDEYEKHLNKLESIVSSFPNNRFYINFIIPRTYIEDRVGIFENVGNTTINLENAVKGNGVSIFYMYAIEQWAYLYFMSLMNESNYNNLITNNEGVGNFYSQFYNEYKEDCEKYINMYKESKVILDRLKQLSDNYENAVITFGVDDPVLSTNITNLENDIKYLLVRGEDNNIIKYIGPNYAYTYAKNLFGSDYANLSSVDDYNHLVLARELNRRNNVKTQFNINYSYNLDNLVGSFDILTINELFEQDKKFINADVDSTNDTIEIDAYFARDLNSDQKNNYISDINSLTKNPMIICNSNYTDSKLLSDIFFENFSVFNFASFGGWNTNANAIGTQIGRTVSYAILSGDINDCIDSK